jgi:Fur family ferric uptake transcriptional regulator
MARASAYNTRQGEAVLTYISAHGDSDITVEQLAAHFAATGISIGMTTIYRNLEKLERRGQVRKVVVDGMPGACYRYVGGTRSDSLRMRCDACGRLYTLDCDEANKFEEHVQYAHRFCIDPVKTVFYGRCGACQEK